MFTRGMSCAKELHKHSALVQKSHGLLRRGSTPPPNSGIQKGLFCKTDMLLHKRHSLLGRPPHEATHTPHLTPKMRLFCKSMSLLQKSPILTISRFCKRTLILQHEASHTQTNYYRLYKNRALFAKETWPFREATRRSHPYSTTLNQNVMQTRQFECDAHTCTHTHLHTHTHCTRM